LFPKVTEEAVEVVGKVNGLPEPIWRVGRIPVLITVPSV
jgi:hypothetical protein